MQESISQAKTLIPTFSSTQDGQCLVNEQMLHIVALLFNTYMSRLCLPHITEILIQILNY